MNSNDVELNHVFRQYGRREGLFAEDRKKGQFADAVVFEQIREIATEQVPVVVYSNDVDFEKAAEPEPNLHHVRSWSELLTLLNVEDDVPNIQGFLDAHANEVAATSLRLLLTYETPFSGQQQGLHWSETGFTEPDTEELVRHVVAEQGPSIRFRDQVFVSGTVKIETALPGEIGSECARRDVPEDRGARLRSGDVVVRFAVEVTAFLLKDEGGRHCGELELETDFGGFAVIPAITWEGESNVNC